ncbi:NADPH-dependent FMN reductase [Halocola ammonii]
MKQKITVIAGTNRENSNSSKVAEEYARLLNQKGAEAQVFNLREMPHDFLASDMYGLRSEEVERIVEKYMLHTDKYIFVVPEYNGGFPGILKAFIDCMNPKIFTGKKAGLIGLSAGRTGSLLGMDHFTGILHYLKVHVHFSKPKLSLIETILDNQEGKLDRETLERLDEHASQMIDF